MRGRCLPWLPTTQVLGVYAYSLFAVMFFVYGLLLLPLELWTPAVEAGAPYKIQGTKRVPRERIVPVMVHAIGHLLTIALPFILWIAHVTVSSRGEHGPRFGGALPRCPYPAPRTPRPPAPPIPPPLTPRHSPWPRNPALHPRTPQPPFGQVHRAGVHAAAPPAVQRGAPLPRPPTTSQPQPQPRP